MRTRRSGLKTYLLPNSLHENGSTSRGQKMFIGMICYKFTSEIIVYGHTVPAKEEIVEYNCSRDTTMVVFKAYVIVPRRNEVAEGGYCIALRPSVRPSVRLE